MIVVFFRVVDKPALKEYQYAEVHHNTPPFVKIEQTRLCIKRAMFEKPSLEPVLDSAIHLVYSTGQATVQLLLRLF
jgi:hypothetical protein